MNIARMLTETITHKVPATGNTYNPGTPTSASIKARWENHTQQIILPDNNVGVSNARVFTIVAVSVGDFLVDDNGRDREVLRVEKMKGTRGTFSHYEVML